MPTPPILIIGYGNTLRSDDAVGYLIAEHIASLNLPNVRSLAVHQLTPELATELAQAQTAIFIDAQWPDIGSIPLQILPLGTDPPLQVNAHTTDPRSLLSLAQSLYGTSPTAYQILIPTTNFSFGETLSQQAQQGMEKAIALLIDFLN